MQLVPVQTAAPATTPVSLEEAKRHLRYTASDQNTPIESLITVATQYLDGYTGILGRALVTQTWRQDLGGFCDQMVLPLAPVTSIESIKYFDADNAQQTLDNTVYVLVPERLGPTIMLLRDQSWPSTYDRPDAVSIEFVAGYGDADAVPAPIKAAILLYIGQLYVNRAAAELPMAAKQLIRPYRRNLI